MPSPLTKCGISGIGSRHDSRVEQLELFLFHLPDDPSETNGVADKYPDLAAKLSVLVKPIRIQLGYTITKIQAEEMRESGYLP